MWYFTVFVIGLFLGKCWKERFYERLYKSQQERGDYWFNKYQAIVRYGPYYPEDYDFFEDPNINNESQFFDDEDDF